MISNSPNGRATQARPPIQLGDFLPEVVDVEINGNVHRAWVTTNRRYPRSVMAKLDRARTDYRLVVEQIPDLPSEQEREDMSAHELRAALSERDRAVSESTLAWDRYLTDSLMALIDTLDESTADMIPREQAEDLLVQLGYLRPRGQPVPVAEGSEAEQEDPSPLTGDTSPDDSPTTTPALMTSGK